MDEAKGSARRLTVMEGGEAGMAEAAGAWALRLADSAHPLPADAWLELTAWLEADPRRREALDEAEHALAAIDRHASVLRLARPARRPVSRLRRWAPAGAATAVAAAVAAIVVIWPRPQAPQEFRAASDAAREVVLADGSTVRLNRGSVLTVAFGPRGRAATLANGGQALFDVAHDPARPFSLAVDGASVRVLGTRFDVDDAPGALRVAVSRGVVAVTPVAGAPATPVPAGEAATRTAGRLALAPVAAQAVGAWAGGRLVYEDAPLSRVAADVSRAWGRPVSASPDTARLRFSGVLRIADPATMTRDLEALAPVALRSDGRHTVIVRNPS